MKFLRTLTALLFAAAVSVTVMAQDRGTRDEAKSLVNAALAHIKKVGNDQAFKDFSTDKANWTKKDLYVLVQDNKGLMLANGANEKMIGKNLIDMKDQNGKPFAREMVDVASRGEGWVDYDWSHPVSKKVEGKSTFVKRIPGFDGFVMVGVYR